MSANDNGDVFSAGLGSLIANCETETNGLDMISSLLRQAYYLAREESGDPIGLLQTTLEMFREPNPDAN